MFFWKLFLGGGTFPLPFFDAIYSLSVDVKDGNEIPQPRPQ